MNLTKLEILDELFYFYTEKEIEEKYSVNRDSDLLKLKAAFIQHIESNKEEIEIQELYKHESDSILIDTPDGYQEIGDFVIKSERECMDLQLEDGYSLKTSKDHKYETKRGWILGKDLESNDSILTKTGYKNIKSITDLEKDIVYDFEVEHENHRYWGGNGISSHNTGKTFVLLNVCREAQKKGYHVYLFDSENAVDESTLNNLGVDLDKITLIPVATIQDFRHQITVIVNSIREAKRAGKTVPKIFFGLDSASQLASSKEVNDAVSGSEKADMTRPKLIRSVFRILTIPLAEIKAPLVFTNHTYEGTDLFSTVNISGGGGILYSASNIMLFRKAKLKDKAKNKVGIVLNAMAHKNRFVKPDKKIAVHIHFTKGMNPFIGLQDYINWDVCGIERGKLTTKTEERQAVDENGELVFYKSGKKKDEPKMETIEIPGEFDFEPKDTASYNFAVKHLSREVEAKDFFKANVFNAEILETLQPIIQNDFKFSKEDFEGGDEHDVDSIVQEEPEEPKD